MSRLGRLRIRIRMLPPLLALTAVLGVLLLESACSRPAGIRSDEVTQTDQHPVPFHDGDGSAPNSAGDSAPNTAENKPKAETGLPFHEPQNLPAGTLLTVRLKTAIAADDAGASGSFEAVVDEPVVVEGNAVVPRGASVAGRVEAARVSNAKSEAGSVRRGFLRLTLDSIDIAGKGVPVQTSSLFARSIAPGGDASAGPVTLEKGRRLTFRLSEPIFFSSQVASQQGLSTH